MLRRMTQQLDSFFGAMADPTRRAVIERLAASPASVSELHKPHPMALPTFLRHLKVLEDTGIVRSVKKGRVRTCYICLLYTSPSPRDLSTSRMPSSA